MVIRIANNGGDPDQLGPLGGSPPAFASNQLKQTVGKRAHDDRLHHAVGADRAGQLVQALLVEAFSRLVCVGQDAFNVDFD